MERGMALIIALPRPARIHWGVDGWQNIADHETLDTGLGLQCCELDASMLTHANRVDFTFQWQDSGDWAGEDFHVTIAAKT
jgi:glucoamylase